MNFIGMNTAHSKEWPATLWCDQNSALVGSTPTPAIALVPQLMAALMSPELKDCQGHSDVWILGYVLQERKRLLEFWGSVGWQDRACAKAEAESLISQRTIYFYTSQPPTSASSLGTGASGRAILTVAYTTQKRACW